MGSSSSKASGKQGKGNAEYLSKALKHGCSYNMKVVIRGETGTGKTCLANRFLGKPMQQGYFPSPGISIGTIPWKHEGDNEIVKIEIWDVVDKVQRDPELSPDSQKSKKHSSKASETSQRYIDSNMLDVYKDVSSVIILVNLTEEFSPYYLQAELSRIPPNIPILLFGNFTDRGFRKVNSLEIKSVVPLSLEQTVIYSEGSLLTGSGLGIVKLFLKYCFLQLQRRTLHDAMTINTTNCEIARQDLMVAVSDKELLKDFSGKFIGGMMPSAPRPEKSPYMPIEEEPPRNLITPVELTDSPSITEKQQQQYLESMKSTYQYVIPDEYGPSVWES